MAFGQDPLLWSKNQSYVCIQALDSRRLLSHCTIPDLLHVVASPMQMDFK